MKLKTTLSLMTACIIGIFPVAALGYWFPPSVPLLLLALLLAAFFFLRFRYFRCPHCAALLSALRIPHFCDNCGHPLQENDHYPQGK